MVINPLLILEESITVIFNNHAWIILKKMITAIEELPYKWQRNLIKRIECSYLNSDF